MKKRMLHILALALALIAVLGLPADALAAVPGGDTASPNTNAYIASCYGSATARSGGAIDFYFFTSGTGPMNRIGATYVEVYDSNGNWQTNLTSSTYPNMLGLNTNLYGATVTYYGTIGTSYYGIVHCYASNTKGYGTMNVTTNTVKAKK